MNGGEKILAAIIAILVVLVVVMGYQLANTNEAIGEGERQLNRLHNKQIKVFELQQDSLFKIIVTLQAENEELTKAKQRVKFVTIREIDSVIRLPFNEQSNFWSNETSRIDSLRSRYIGINN